MRRFLLFLLIATPVAAADSGVTFTAPRRHASAVGPSKAQVEVTAPAGTTATRVALFVDGKPAGSKTEPPWTFDWDAGDGSVEHKLDALATFSDGTEARTKVVTSKLTINATEEVALVNLYAIARTAKGAYVNDLQQSDFRIFENGNAEKIERFSAARRALRIAVVLDTSLSMEGDKLKSAIDSAVAFLDILQPGD